VGLKRDAAAQLDAWGYDGAFLAWRNQSSSHQPVSGPAYDIPASDSGRDDCATVAMAMAVAVCPGEVAAVSAA
jgi:hypothetical protein